MGIFSTTLFFPGFEKSKFFSKAPKEVIDTFLTENVTYNLHRFCLTESALKKNDILDEWKILSTNQDVHGERFVSSMEHKEYPIYGVQFHPERNAFEFKKNVGVSHAPSGIKAMQYLANFFVDECRKNSNSFHDYQTELNYLIYNYSPIYTGKKNSSYEQVYAFEKTDYENKLP